MFQSRLKKLPRYLRVTFSVVFLFNMLCLTVTSFLMPKTYLSTALVAVAPANGQSSADVLKEEFQRVHSRDLLVGVINRLGLKEAWARRYYNEDRPLQTDYALNLLTNRLILKTTGGNQINIGSVSDESVEAAMTANTIAESLVELQTKTNLANAGLGTGPAARVTIVERATPSPKPWKPNVLLNIAIGIPISAIYGCFAAFLAFLAAKLIRAFSRPTKNPPA